MKILIADDHALLRDSLVLLLTDHYGSSLSIFQACDGCSTLQQAERHADLDIILLDIDLPDMHGFEVIQVLKKKSHNIPIIAFSGISTPPFIQQCMSLGVAGFIPKTLNGKEMISAIDLVLQGGCYIPRAALSGLQDNSTQTTLTSRQIDVLRLIQKGMSNDDIASVLSIKATTVKTHVSGMLASLGVKNRTEAVNEAMLLHVL